MSEENNNKALTTTTPAKARNTLIASIKNPNDKLQKDLKKHVNKALDFLVNMLDDEEADPKDKKDAAKFIVATYQSVTDSCTKFALQQVVLDMKQKAIDSPKDVTPTGQQVIFTTNVYDPNKLDGDNDEDSPTFNANWDMRDSNSNVDNE